MVDYNPISQKFSQSRKGMRWEEIEYFFSLSQEQNILDIWCGNGRLLEQYKNIFQVFPEAYIWIDVSSGMIDQAQRLYPEFTFLESDMNNLNIWYFREYHIDSIFCIAAFHHLEDFNQRKLSLEQMYHILPSGWKIYMTNWALESSVNFKKYQPSKIWESENEMGGSDFSIKFGEYDRYYHNFSLDELRVLFESVGFHILENRIFDTQKNFITIAQK